MRRFKEFFGTPEQHKKFMLEFFGTEDLEEAERQVKELEKAIKEARQAVKEATEK